MDGDGNGVTLNMRFPGQYFDAETGLHYNYFRYYDPSTGRYITSDPIGLTGGLNTYGYTYQNPTGNVDPLGLSSWVVAYWSKYLADQKIEEGRNPDEVFEEMGNALTGGNECLKCFLPDFYDYDDYAEGAGGKVAGPLGKYIVKKATRVYDVYDIATCLKECKEDDESCETGK